MARSERRLRRAREAADRGSPQTTPRALRLLVGGVALLGAGLAAALSYPQIADGLRSGADRRVDGRTVGEWAAVLAGTAGGGPSPIADRQRAIVALATAQNPVVTRDSVVAGEATLALVRALRDPDATVAATAADALADAGVLPEAAVRDVSAAAVAGSTTVRVRALGLLPRVPPAARPAAARQLAGLLRDPDTTVWRAALEALARLAPQLDPAAQRALAPAVTAAARAGSPAARATALDAYGAMADALRPVSPADTAAADGAWGLLAPALADPFPEVRVAAAAALGELVSAGAWSERRRLGAVVGALTGALEDPDADVRREAARALGAAGPAARPATASLRARLADPNPGVQSAARDALARVTLVGDSPARVPPRAHDPTAR